MFSGQPEIDEIAGHHDVVDRLLRQIRRDHVDDVAHVHVAALAHQLARPSARLRLTWPGPSPRIGARCTSDRWARVKVTAGAMVRLARATYTTSHATLLPLAKQPEHLNNVASFHDRGDHR